MFKSLFLKIKGNHKELLRQNGLYAALVQKQIHGDNDTDSIVSRSGVSTPSLANVPLQLRFSDTSNNNV